MKDLAKEIERAPVPEDSVALWWLAQAGFVFKSHAGTVLYLDAYLTDVVEKAFGFKRLSLAPMDAEDVRADWIVNSHEHLDHLDTDALPVIARNNPSCRFAGSPSCETEYRKAGIAAHQYLIMTPGETHALSDITVHTARADHGDLSPTALSLLFEVGRVRVLFTGDTALNLEWMQPLVDLKPDVLLPCINGRFGNLDAMEAAHLTGIVRPRVAIPCHFWMFKEHNGDPEAFVQACATTCPSAPITLLMPGDGLLVTPESVCRVET